MRSSPPRLTTRPPPSNLRVLLVDDDPHVLRALGRLIQSLGYDVIEAEDGEAALEAFGQRIDVVVSDIAMPGLSGVALLRAIRERDLDVPVVLITGSPSVETAAEAMRWGACDYLTKPVEPEVLAATMRRATRLGRLARAKREALEGMLHGRHGGGDRAGLEVAFERALESMWVAYQPIVDRDGRIFGHEALLRSVEPAIPGPGAMLDAAEELDRLHEVGRRMRALASQPIAADANAGVLFVNLHPHDLFDDDLVRPGAPLTAVADRVVLELTERTSLGELDEVRWRVAELRALGFRLAIDDLGAGYAGLSAFAVLEPDIVKLDMSLIRGVDASRTKQRLVASMTEASHDLGMRVVAEGVETVAELDTVLRLGCDLVQGFLLAPPGRAFPPRSWPPSAAPSEP